MVAVINSSNLYFMLILMLPQLLQKGVQTDLHDKWMVLKEFSPHTD